mgnify:CR=1 FL=1
MNEVDKILKEDQKAEKKAKRNVDWQQKLPTYLKLNIVFAIVGLVGLIMGIVAATFIINKQAGTPENNWSIFWASFAFFMIGYVFGLIYSACLYGLYPQSATKISLLKAHYIINFVPIANTIAFITAIIIYRRHEYDLI